MSTPQFFRWTSGASSGGSLTTNNVNTNGTSGGLCIVIVSEESSAGSITGVTDNQNNTWNALPQQTNGTHISRVFYATLVNVSISHTFTGVVSGAPSGSGQVQMDLFVGTGGPTIVTGAPTILAAYIQAVQGATGPFITHVATNALIYCEADDGGVASAYTAGSGYTLSLGGNAGSRIGSQYQSGPNGTYGSSFGGTSGNIAWNLLVFRQPSDPGAPIKTAGDFSFRVVAASKLGAQFTVAPSTLVPGASDILRNGVRKWSFLFPPSSAGPGTDANSTGTQVQLFDVNGVAAVVDAKLFLNNLS